jgi:hypothetical protein
MSFFSPEILSLYQNQPIIITIRIMKKIKSSPILTHHYTIHHTFYHSFPNSLQELIHMYPFLSSHINTYIDVLLQKDNHKINVLSNTLYYNG